MTSQPQYLSEIYVHCHGLSFDPIFIKFGMCVPALITMFVSHSVLTFFFNRHFDQKLMTQKAELQSQIESWVQVLTCQISWKSDQNWGRDSARVFPTNMTAVTSSIMRMSKNILVNNLNISMIMWGKSNLYWFLRFGPRTLLKNLLFSMLKKFDR